jgi:hypothetical protein
MAKSKERDWDDPENEVQSNWIKWNVPMEDKILGTLIAKRQIKSTIPGKEGEMTNVYEIKAQKGVFHKLDEKKKVVEEPITINENEIWSVGGTAVIDRQMQNIQKGQIIGLKFIEEKPSKTKGFAPAKIVKVYTPKDEATGEYLTDTEWLEKNKEDEPF